MNFNYGIPFGNKAGSMFKSFMHPEAGYDAAADRLNKSMEGAMNYERPYTNAGLDQIGKLTGAEDKLFDPTKLQDEWSSHYEMSPEARMAQEHAKSSGLDAASSMGLMGSSAALGNIENQAGEIMQKDRRGYMDDLMQKYMTAIGLGQNIYNTGANTAGNMAQQNLGFGETMAPLDAARVNAPGEMFGKLAGMGASAGLNYLTGGMGSGGAGAMRGMFQPTPAAKSFNYGA